VDLQIRLAAAEEALDVLKDVAFLNEDNFGSQMKDARTQFIQNLARYAKKVSTDFMKDNVVYSTVIAYGRHENLTAWYTMGTPQKRANITTVKTALIVWLTTHAETLKQQIDAATLSFSGVDSGLKSSGGRSLLHYLGSELDLSASELEGAA
jgi:hypothetical protein